MPRGFKHDESAGVERLTWHLNGGEMEIWRDDE